MFRVVGRNRREERISEVLGRDCVLDEDGRCRIAAERIPHRLVEHPIRGKAEHRLDRRNRLREIFARVGVDHTGRCTCAVEQHLRLQNKRARALEWQQVRRKDRGVHLLDGEAFARPLGGRRRSAWSGRGSLSCGRRGSRSRGRARRLPRSSSLRRPLDLRRRIGTRAGLDRDQRRSRRLAWGRRNGSGGRGSKRRIRGRLRRTWSGSGLCRRRALFRMLSQHTLDQGFEALCLASLHRKGERGGQEKRKARRSALAPHPDHADCAPVCARWRK